MYHTEPPTDKTIPEWYMKIQQSGCIALRNEQAIRVHRLRLKRVRDAFVRSPQKSTTRACRELQISQSSVWRILRKRLRVKGFRLQLLQALNPQDHNLRLRFCLEFQQRLLEDGFAETWFSVMRRRFMCVVR